MQTKCWVFEGGGNRHAVPAAETDPTPDIDRILARLRRRWGYFGPVAVTLQLARTVWDDHPYHPNAALAASLKGRP